MILLFRQVWNVVQILLRRLCAGPRSRHVPPAGRMLHGAGTGRDRPAQVYNEKFRPFFYVSRQN